MSISNGNKYVLKNKEGKFIIIRQFENEKKLFIGDSQENATVIIHQRRGFKMAFEFSDEGIHYFPKVEGNSLKLEYAGNGKVLQDSHWFKRENTGGGDHYLLKSVVSPMHYLCKKGSTLGLSTRIDEPIQVTHAEII